MLRRREKITILCIAILIGLTVHVIATRAGTEEGVKTSKAEKYLQKEYAVTATCRGIYEGPRPLHPPKKFLLFECVQKTLDGDTLWTLRRTSKKWIVK